MVMPTMNFNIDDFNKLAGKKFKDKELDEKIPLFGAVVEKTEGREMEIEVFPDRPDLLSVEGLARAFSGFMGVKKGYVGYPSVSSGVKVIVDKSVNKIRPHIACAVLKDVKLTDEMVKSLMQLQEKLHASHCRKRKKASIGVYDLDSIKFPVTYKAEGKNLKFVPLEFKEQLTLEDILKKHPKGKDYAWILEGKEKYPVLVDAKGMVLSMPPIINSEDSKVKKDSKGLFIDVTGMDKKTVNEALNIVVCALADRGADIKTVNVVYSDKNVKTPQLGAWEQDVKISYINKILGLELSGKDVCKLLEKMRFFAAEISKGNIRVKVPPYRTDIMHPIDIAEDVAIAYGYNNFKPEIPSVATIGDEREAAIFSRKIRDLMIGLGFSEALTFILTNKDDLFLKMGLKEEKIAEASNPRTVDYYGCRNWLLPSLMKALTVNKHNLFPQKLFEVGECVVFDKTDTGTRTVLKLAGVASYEKCNLTEIKSIVESILKNLGLEYEIKSFEHPSFIDNRCGEIIVNGGRIGFFGEINPFVLSKWNLEMPIIGMEIDLEKLL
ncbi:MAG: phenylalanine--tRNA ligase subunit beta [Candidatus Aenigmarchaeota archaeon]|nr:phenylalanine--tRNA ligase subunit beta [Candidatus Aenigmarchaeota archaeon]